MNSQSDLEFWKKKSVVVTGGAGFLGSVLVKKIEGMGVSQLFVPRSRDYDLTRMENVVRLYDEKRPDIVLHLAALCGGIGANMDRPADFFYNNLMMGVQLMEVARQKGVEKFVALGTICAYPKHSPVPFRERDLWNGYPEETNAPYGIAKKMLLVQAQAYRKQYGFNAIYLLPVNLYGPGDNFNLNTSHVIPALIRKFIEARDRKEPSVVCWGTGQASREFLYVEDAAEAILLASSRYNGDQPVNIGCGLEISIFQLAELIKRITKFQGSIVWDATKPDGQPHRRLDTTKAKELFGFKAKTPLEEGLKHVVEWYESNNSPHKTLVD